MTWTRIAQHESKTTASMSFRRPSTNGYNGHSESTTTKALDLWRCDGCRMLACGPVDENPGACLNRACRFFKSR